MVLDAQAQMTRGEKLLYGCIAFLQLLILLLRIYVLFREKWIQVDESPRLHDEL